MAVAGLKKISGSVAVGDNTSEHTYQLVYQVVFATGDLANPGTAMAEIAIPLGTAFDYFGYVDLYSFLHSYSFEAVSSPDGSRIWNVTLDYRNLNPSTSNEDPTQNLPIITISGVPYETILSIDATGAAVLNSAGDPFDPPCMRDQHRMSIRIERNEASFDLGIPSTYQDCVNSQPWLGFPVSTVKCMNIDVSQEYAPIIGPYFKCVYSFEINTLPVSSSNVPGWQPSILDQGFRYIDGTGHQAAILDDQGVAVTSPKLLNGHGAVLPDGTPPSQAVFLPYAAYNKIDFNSLGFDFSYLPLTNSF